MPFEKDLFISYAHIDNIPLTEKQKGWVTRFHTTLEAMVSPRLGYKARIWRDMRLAGNDVFNAEIAAQLPKAAVLVSVLSPRYVDSKSCLEEAWEFCRAAEKTAGLVVDHKSRIFKVVKMPVEKDDTLPPVVKTVLGYEFFELADDQSPVELDPEFGQQAAEKYFQKVARLASHIAQLIKALQATPEAQAAAAPAPGPAKPAVYLAECAYDRRDAREALQAELRQRGYTVLPDEQLPRDEDAYRAEAARLIGQCSISIHLVGGMYGAVPDGPSQKSVAVLQNELAIERSRATGMRRVIWLPEGVASTQADQQAFIDALHRDADVQFGADLITADLETFKTAVLSTLQRIEEPQPKRQAQAATEGEPKMVYVICDPRDPKATVPLRRYLGEQGIDVQIPVFEGEDSASVRQANLELLTQCDGVILYYGAGDDAWKRSIDSELRKRKGYPNARRLAASFVYVAEPTTPAKSDLIDVGGKNLIDGRAGFSEAALRPMLQLLGVE